MLNRHVLALGGALLLAATPYSFAAAQECQVIVYFDVDFGGQSQSVTEDQNWVGNHWNDQISSIRAVKGTWRFFREVDYKGDSFEVIAGSNLSYVGDKWNDQISSFKCER